MTAKLARIGVVMLVMGAMSTPASGQETPPRSSGLFSPSTLERLVRESSQGSPRIRLSQTTGSGSNRRKDSILNGALIGAAIGGIGGSFLLVAASGGSDDFRGAMLRVAPVTAFAGFVVGAAIDALR
jgi:hypothetical protein